MYQQDRGQILVMFAITATAMLAMIGLMYSFGAILSQRRALQSAADAASLGGTWQVLSELSSDNCSDANVMATVLRYATSNGAAAGGVSAFYVDGSGTQVTAVGAGGKFRVDVRGVRVSVTGDVPTILPGFVKVFHVLVQDTATAAAQPTTPPGSAPLVIPIALSASAYAPHATFDLLSGRAQTLDLSSAGAPTFGSSASTNEQFWSDGQHSGSWQLSLGTVKLANAAYYDSIAAGLRDNVRRQGLVDQSGNAYALVTAPVFSSATSSTVTISGFVQLKIFGSSITSTSAPALFVPYASAAFGTPQVPTLDLGATLVGIIS
jgi:Flp pilus assembly protein TadG